MLNSRFTCPKVRAAKQDKVIKLIRQHRIEVEQRMYELRRKESHMVKQLLDIVFEEEHDKEDEVRIDRIHG
jgi:hypothetical protein